MTQIDIHDPKYIDYTEWSPKGDKIVYTESLFHAGQPTEIYTINLDGSGRTCLTCDQDFDVGKPSFSPDGSKIVYFSHIHDSEDIGDIWVMDIDGKIKYS